MRHPKSSCDADLLGWPGHRAPSHAQWAVVDVGRPSPSSHSASGTTGSSRSRRCLLLNSISCKARTTPRVGSRGMQNLLPATAPQQRSTCPPTGRSALAGGAQWPTPAATARSPLQLNSTLSTNTILTPSTTFRDSRPRSKRNCKALNNSAALMQSRPVNSRRERAASVS